MVRRLTPQDAQLLRTLRIQALSDAPFAFRGLVSEEIKFPASAWSEMLSADKNPFFVVEVGNEVCGIAGVLVPDDEREAHLWFLWVPPTHRGRGNSGLLVNHVIVWARTATAARLLLHCTEGNVHAENLYRRHGFERTGASVERDRDGATEFEMALVLSTSCG